MENNKFTLYKVTKKNKNFNNENVDFDEVKKHGINVFSHNKIASVIMYFGLFVPNNIAKKNHYFIVDEKIKVILNKYVCEKMELL